MSNKPTKECSCQCHKLNPDSPQDKHCHICEPKGLLSTILKEAEIEFENERVLFRKHEIEDLENKKQQTLKQIENWCDEQWVSAPIGDVKLLHYEDLKKFINTLWIAQ
jgi:hypothetical protein